MIPFFLEKYPNYKKLFRQSLLSVSQQEHHGEEIREEETRCCTQDQATGRSLCSSRHNVPRTVKRGRTPGVATRLMTSKDKLWMECSSVSRRPMTNMTELSQTTTRDEQEVPASS